LLIQSLLYKRRDLTLNGHQSENNFNLLELLTSAPTFNIVEPNENFVVCIDAYKEGIGGDLTQKGHVIGYGSINIK
jgi:hypothetical protein